MKIKSKFYDFYDCVGVGTKEGSFYVREEKEALIKGFPLKRRMTFFSTDEVNTIPLLNGGGSNSPTYQCGFVVLAGTIYPYITCALNNKVEFLWDYASIEAGFKDTVSKDILKNFKSLMQFKGSKVAETWAIENKIVVADCFGTPNTPSRAAFCWGKGYTSPYASKELDIFTLNPNLSAMQFQRCMDPYMTYQELDMWVGGVLTNTENPPDIADKHKIDQHGFDQWSFRKLPSTEK